MTMQTKKRIWSFEGACLPTAPSLPVSPRRLRHVPLQGQLFTGYATSVACERGLMACVPIPHGGCTVNYLPFRAAQTQFYVENVPGAGGNIGMARAAQAAPDGYTLAVIDVTASVVNPRLTKVTYDPFKDFDPIALPATTTQVLVVHPSLPVRTVTEIVALIRANPGKYNYGSAGIGSASHLTAELFRTSLGLDLIHIPFNGAGPAIASTLGGHTPIAFGSPASTVAQVNEGSLRGLAVASRTRLAAMPQVPTMGEAGLPDIVCDARLGMVAPAGTPHDILALLNREISKLIELADVKERLATFGFEGSANTPEESATLIRAESAKWAKVIQDAGIKTQ
jgi:tripartite-type tricarboxylate transporter receptor subunit TctC